MAPKKTNPKPSGAHKADGKTKTDEKAGQKVERPTTSGTTNDDAKVDWRKTAGVAAGVAAVTDGGWGLRAAVAAGAFRDCEIDSFLDEIAWLWEASAEATAVILLPSLYQRYVGWSSLTLAFDLHRFANDPKNADRLSCVVARLIFARVRRGGNPHRPCLVASTSLVHAEQDRPLALTPVLPTEWMPTKLIDDAKRAKPDVELAVVRGDGDLWRNLLRYRPSLQATIDVVPRLLEWAAWWERLRPHVSPDRFTKTLDERVHIGTTSTFFRGSQADETQVYMRVVRGFQRTMRSWLLEGIGERSLSIFYMMLTQTNLDDMRRCSTAGGHDLALQFTELETSLDPVKHLRSLVHERTTTPHKTDTPKKTGTTNPRGTSGGSVVEWGLPRDVDWRLSPGSAGWGESAEGQEWLRSWNADADLDSAARKFRNVNNPAIETHLQHLDTLATAFFERELRASATRVDAVGAERPQICINETARSLFSTPYEWLNPEGRYAFYFRTATSLPIRPHIPNRNTTHRTTHVDPAFSPPPQAGDYLLHADDGVPAPEMAARWELPAQSVLCGPIVVSNAGGRTSAFKAVARAMFRAHTLRRWGFEVPTVRLLHDVHSQPDAWRQTPTEQTTDGATGGKTVVWLHYDFRWWMCGVHGYTAQQTLFGTLRLRTCGERWLKNASSTPLRREGDPARLPLLLRLMVARVLLGVGECGLSHDTLVHMEDSRPVPTSMFAMRASSSYRAPSHCVRRQKFALDAPAPPDNRRRYVGLTLVAAPPSTNTNTNTTNPPNPPNPAAANAVQPNPAPASVPTNHAPPNGQSNPASGGLGNLAEGGGLGGLVGIGGVVGGGVKGWDGARRHADADALLYGQPAPTTRSWDFNVQLRRALVDNELDASALAALLRPFWTAVAEDAKSGHMPHMWSVVQALYETLPSLCNKDVANLFPSPAVSGRS